MGGRFYRAFFQLVAQCIIDVPDRALTRYSDLIRQVQVIVADRGYVFVLILEQVAVYIVAVICLRRCARCVDIGAVATGTEVSQFRARVVEYVNLKDKKTILC